MISDLLERVFWISASSLTSTFECGCDQDKIMSQSGRCNQEIPRADWRSVLF